MKEKKKKISLDFENHRLEVIVRQCNFFERFLGLMFTRRKNAEALLFEFNQPTSIRIHSFFVFFPFIAIWLDEKDKIINVEKVNPFKLDIKGPRNFKKLLEIPLNKKYSKEFSFVVDN
ncbi:DUF192 domain-containing protein [Patescibacteria group bacterium]|nr:DUF192 domain-containing protein [Patescibacteria group bacterium]